MVELGTMFVTESMLSFGNLHNSHLEGYSTRVGDPVQARLLA